MSSDFNGTKNISIYDKIIKLARMNKCDLIEGTSDEKNIYNETESRGISADAINLRKFKIEIIGIQKNNKEFDCEVYSLAIEILILLRKRDRKFVVKLLMDQDISVSDDLFSIKKSEMGEYYFNRVKRIKSEYPILFQQFAECIKTNRDLGYSNILKVIARIEVGAILRGW